MGYREALVHALFFTRTSNSKGTNEVVRKMFVLRSVSVLSLCFGAVYHMSKS